MQSIGDQIRSIREQLAMTQAQLAERSGLHSQSMIADIENGKRLNLTLPTISKLAKGLNCQYVSQLQPLKDIADILDDRSTEVAQKCVDLASGSAALELQSPSQESVTVSVATLKMRLLEDKSSLWQKI